MIGAIGGFLVNSCKKKICKHDWAYFGPSFRLTHKTCTRCNKSEVITHATQN